MKESFRFYSNFKVVEILLSKVSGIQNIDFKKNYYKYLYIINVIIFYKIKYSVEADFKGVPINSDLLSDIIKVQNSSKFLRNLRDWKLIEIVGQYVIDVHSNYYDLCKEFRDDELYIIYVNRSEYPLLIDRLNFEAENSLTGVTKKLHNILCDNISLSPEGIAYLGEVLKIQPEYVKYKTSKLKNDIEYEGEFIMKGFRIHRNDLKLLDIYNKKFDTVRPIPGSRIYSNLTSLKREHRRFLLFNGNPLLMTDISCSQILLSVEVLLKQYSITSGVGRNDIPEDILFYKRLAENGLFYDFMAGFSKLWITIPKERSKFKKQFFIDVFFSKVANWTTDIKTAFQQSFPTVAQLINDIKKTGHGEFAVQLQKFEASIIIDKAAKELIRQNKKVLTLHDAIIADNEETLKMAESIIERELIKLKTPLKPHFKRDNGLLLRDLYSPKESETIIFPQMSIQILDFELFIKELGYLSIEEFRSVAYILSGFFEGFNLIPIHHRDYAFNVIRRGNPTVVRYEYFGSDEEEEYEDDEDVDEDYEGYGNVDTNEKN